MFGLGPDRIRERKELGTLPPGLPRHPITGLNGSGKSNILDAICFVLGITNLSQVRAGNLSELVYKQGQAGVNKAVVTIIFNNEDASNSPVGYEQCPTVTVTRQVLLGGKSKYVINGRNAPVGQVQNLFHSVQLNVNNPHFLIMQGRITKVLNMKPHEILGMVEEAAGTRMYETKRQAALKTIEKKQAKLEDLNNVLAEEITPTLERLRGEKQAYLQWSKNNADIERLERFLVAKEFMDAQDSMNDSSVQEMEQRVAILDEEVTGLNQKISRKEAEIEERSCKLKGEFESQLAKAKKSEQKLSHDLVRSTTAWKNANDSLKKAADDVETAKAFLIETEQSIAIKKEEIDEEAKKIEGITQAAKDAEDYSARLALQYQNMSAGISQDCSLPEQIMKAHADSKAAEAKVQQAHMKITHLSKELKVLERDIDKEKKSGEKLAAKCEAAKKKVFDIKSEMEKLEFSELEWEQLEKEKNELETETTELTDKIELLTVQLESKLAFNYSDPVMGFDRSKVKGIVAKLIQLKDSKNSTALEVAAGNRLFQVVVDESITGKALLERGKLARRVTIIPLDKITSHPLSHNTVKQAKSIADSMNSSACPAMELVGFDEEVRKAVEYVFGSTIIVDGVKAANQICESTKTRAVTLDGDMYNPEGTITGGSKGQLGTVLSNLVQLTEFSSVLEVKRSRLSYVTKRILSLKSTAAKFDKLKNQLGLAEAESSESEKHLSQTSFGVLLDKRKSMEDELRLANEESVTMKEEQNIKWLLYEQLKDREVELTQEREERLCKIENEVKSSKASAVEKMKAAREAESRLQTMYLELDSLKAELLAAQDALDIARRSFDAVAQQESSSQIELGRITALYDEAKDTLHNMERQIEAFSTEVMELKADKSCLVQQLETVTVEKKKISVAITHIMKERTESEKVISSILKRYPWIESERAAFGVPGGDYDFAAVDTKALNIQLKRLRGDQESLAKKINKKVMGMIEKAESEYTELLRKRKVVENDKKKIQKVIEELDVKKKSELQRTWVKVNNDFGSIFSTLLPGAKAKVEPPEGMEAWEGLEVKVAFGDEWKESLSELSGGQRSLLALSLILSLLLFKPAPMYILDEVDAALDLSHTQNIGNMLKTHFSQSQFIVVSLKEGMFNNANVIFRTKFIDGVSTVSRTIGLGSKVPVGFGDATNEASSASFLGRKTQGKGTSRNGKENSA